ARSAADVEAVVHAVALGAARGLLLALQLDAPGERIVEHGRVDERDVALAGAAGVEGRRALEACPVAAEGLGPARAAIRPPPAALLAQRHDLEQADPGLVHGLDAQLGAPIAVEVGEVAAAHAELRAAVADVLAPLDEGGDHARRRAGLEQGDPLLL